MDLVICSIAGERLRVQDALVLLALGLGLASMISWAMFLGWAAYRAGRWLAA